MSKEPWHPLPGHKALRRGRVSLPNNAYLVTTTTRDREPIFRNFRSACLASRSFTDLTVLGDATLLAWVLMPDHVHWLLQLGERSSLSQLINRLKSASARKVNEARGLTGPLWAPAFHDHALRAEEDLRTVARYVIANPIRAGLVERVGDYPFWNVVWL
ncbi:MAG: REP-associated tyrosine transposase [Panacagrimonas sp.]